MMNKLRKEFQKRVAGYITAAFGLVAGLAWNEAIKTLINYLFPMSQNTLIAQFIYAIVITVVLVIVTIYIVGRFDGSEEEDESAEKKPTKKKKK